MSDPYLEWLGIPAQSRPPTYYQLLGISPSELDPNAISAAAERQLDLVRLHESGDSGDQSRRIAAEIVKARDTLLDPIAKQRYDSLTPDAAEPWWKPEEGSTAPSVAASVAAEWWKGKTIPSPPTVKPTSSPIIPQPASALQTADLPPIPTLIQPSVTAPVAADSWWKPETPIPSVVEKKGDDWWKVSVSEGPPSPAPPPSPPVSAAAPNAEPATPAPVRPIQATFAPATLVLSAPAAPVPPPAAPVPPATAAATPFTGVSPAIFRARRGVPLPAILIGVLLVAGAVASGVFFLNKQKSADSAKEVAEVQPKKETVTSSKKKEVGNGSKSLPIPLKKVPDPKTVEPEAKKLEPEPVTKKVEPEPKPIPEPVKVVEPTGPATYRGHAGTVLGIAVSKDAQTVLSVSNDKDTHIYRGPEGKQALMYPLRSEGVAIAFCKNDKQAVFCDGGLTSVYDMDKKDVTHTFENPRGGVESMAVAPDGSFVLTGATDGCVRRWNVAANKLTNTLDIDEKSIVTALAVSANGQLGAFGLSDGRVCIWDLPQTREVKRWKAHDGRVTTLSIAPNGQRILSGGDDNIARVWEIMTGKMIQKLIGHKGPVLGGGWCSDGNRVITGGIDKKIMLWDASTGKKSDWSATTREKIFCLAIDGRDRFVFAGQSDGIIQRLPLPAAGEAVPQPRDGDPKD